MLLRNQGLFPVSPVQLTSRCAGAGREHSQAAGPGWPMGIFHTMDVMLSLWMGVGQEAGILSFPWVRTFPWVWSSSQWVQTCPSVRSFSWVWWVLWNSRDHWNLWAPGNLQVLQLLLRDWLRNWLLGCEKNCMVYSLFCIFSNISSNGSIFLVVLLNCLYLSPWVSPFVHFFSPSHCGGRGGVSEQLSGAWFPAAGLNHSTCNLEKSVLHHLLYITDKNFKKHLKIHLKILIVWSRDQPSMLAPLFSLKWNLNLLWYFFKWSLLDLFQYFSNLCISKDIIMIRFHES